MILATALLCFEINTYYIDEAAEAAEAHAHAAQAMQRPQEKNTIALSAVPTIEVIRPIVANVCFSPTALASFLAPADLIIPMIPTTIATNVATITMIPEVRVPSLVDVSTVLAISDPMLGITREAIPNTIATI